MVVFAYLIMLAFCAAFTFAFMALIISKANIQEEEKDPAQFLMGNISYESTEEFGLDYQTEIPKFMTRYGFDRKGHEE